MNWGTGLVIAFVCFGIFIFTQVYRTFQHDHQLVAEDYYAQEVAYESTLEQQRRAAELDWSPSWGCAAGMVELDFSGAPANAPVVGSIRFQRPSDKRLDVAVPIALNANLQQSIDADQLQHGRYRVAVEWAQNGTTYIHKGTIFIP